MSDQIRASFHSLLEHMEDPPRWDDLTLTTVSRPEMNRPRGWLVAATVMVLVVVLVGSLLMWSEDASPDVADASPVDGVWEMVEFTISGTTQPVLIGTNTPDVPWVRFEAGQMSGSAGCNQYGGPFTFEDGRISADPVIDSGFCADGTGTGSLMEADRAFVAVVGGFEPFVVSVVGRSMVWTLGDDELVFVAIDGPPGPFPPFEEATASTQLESWLWHVVEGDFGSAEQLVHPAAVIDVADVATSVRELDGAFNVIVDRRVSGTQDAPATCYAITNGQTAVIGSAVFRLRAGDWRIWDLTPEAEGCRSLIEDVTYQVRGDVDGSSWIVSGCPGTDQGLTGGSGDALPPADSVLTLNEVEAIWGGREDAMIIPRNGEGWVRTSEGVQLVRVEDYVVRIMIDDPAGCPGVPSIVEGVPLIYQVKASADVNGRLPTGLEYTIDFDPSFGPVSIEGVSAAIILDLDAAGLEPSDVGCDSACEPVIGITRFRRTAGTGSSYENGTLNASSGDWTMSIAIYEHITSGWTGVDVGGTLLGHIRPIEVTGGLPAFEITGPLRWATDEEIPLQMEIDYGRFVVRRGCGNLAVACSTSESVQLIPADRVFSPVDPWDYVGDIIVKELNR